jgi:hypothetical protein
MDLQQEIRALREALALVEAEGADLTKIREPKRSGLSTKELGVRPARYGTADYRQNPHEGYNNIAKVLSSASDEEIEYWSRWYYNASQDVRSLASKHKIPFRTAAAIVAVLSPGNKWTANLAAADKLLSGADTINSYPENIRKARAMLDSWKTDRVSGPKVTVFFNSLVDPKATAERMTLDGHAINIWRGTKRGLKGINTPKEGSAERKQMLADYAAVAKDFGLSTQAVQAITWYIWKYTENPAPPADLNAIIRGLDNTVSVVTAGPSSMDVRVNPPGDPKSYVPPEGSWPKPREGSLPYWSEPERVPYWKREDRSLAREKQLLREWRKR